MTDIRNGNDFDQLIDGLDKDSKDKIKEIREIILDVCPSAKEYYFHRWRSVSFRYRSDKIDDYAILKLNDDDQVLLIFPKGIEIDDDKSILKEYGKLERFMLIEEELSINVNLISDYLKKAKLISETQL